ncbi:putative F-box domain-containing protein [Seiridium cardinale]|uniref:F-box domain-containing protein n=1 Tax=Seiridium cardinale TaxID=138064 RepID=A0ABR2XVG7_9PEZI
MTDHGGGEGGLERLPPELKQHIFKSLDFASVPTLALISKTFFQIFKGSENLIAYAAVENAVGSVNIPIVVARYMATQLTWTPTLEDGMRCSVERLHTELKNFEVFMKNFPERSSVDSSQRRRFYPSDGYSALLSKFGVAGLNRHRYESKDWFFAEWDNIFYQCPYETRQDCEFMEDCSYWLLDERDFKPFQRVYMEELLEMYPDVDSGPADLWLFRLMIGSSRCIQFQIPDDKDGLHINGGPPLDRNALLELCGDSFPTMDEMIDAFEGVILFYDKDRPRRVTVLEPVEN